MIEETEAEADEESVIASMTEEADIATRAPLPQGSATTDTGALLQHAELTATSQHAHPETILRVVVAHPPTTAVPPPRRAAADATPPALTPTPRLHARLADAATTDLHHEMLRTARAAKAQASAVMKAADPVRVLLLTSVAHDHPDVTADPTTTAVTDHPLETVARHHRRNAAVGTPNQSPVHRRAGVVTFPARVLARLPGVAGRVLTAVKSASLAPTVATAVVVAAVADQLRRHLSKRARDKLERPICLSTTSCWVKDLAHHLTFIENVYHSLCCVP